YDDKMEWRKVGMAIKNEMIDGNDDYFFNLWHEWSKKSEKKYKGIDDCRKEWKTFDYRTEGNRLTVNFLVEELEKRNAIAYKKIEPIVEFMKFLKKIKSIYYPKNECIPMQINFTDRKVW